MFDGLQQTGGWKEGISKLQIDLSLGSICQVQFVSLLEFRWHWDEEKFNNSPLAPDYFSREKSSTAGWTELAAPASHLHSSSLPLTEARTAAHSLLRRSCMCFPHSPCWVCSHRPVPMTSTNPMFITISTFPDHSKYRLFHKRQCFGIWQHFQKQFSSEEQTWDVQPEPNTSSN